VRPELLDADLERPLLAGEPLLLGIDFGNLRGQAFDLGESCSLPLQGDAGEVVAAGADCPPGLLVELRNARCQLLGLALQLLLRRRHLDQSLAELDQQELLLAVGVVEDLSRVLGAVHRARRLGGKDQLEPRPQAHQDLPPYVFGAGAHRMTAG